MDGRKFRDNGCAGVSPVIIAVVIIAILAVALVLFNGSSKSEGYDPEKDYVPELEVTLYRNDAGDIYRADMHLDVQDPSFFEYLFGSLSVADSGLPSGDKELRFDIYEGTQTNKKENHLTSKRFMITAPEARESTYDIEFPALKLTEQSAPTVIHLWGFAYFDDDLICQKHWTVNPDDMSIAAG